MSVNHTQTPSGDAPQESDTPMFAPIPSWERGRKRRGARRAEVSNSAAAPITNDKVGRETAMSADGDAPFVAPQTRTVVRRNGSVAPAAIAVGLIALAALAAAGWYATRPADRTMTPGATPATAIATAPPASTGPSAMAANTPPSSAADTTATTPSTTTTTTTSHRAVAMHTARTATPVVRSHSTTSRSATSAGVNTGATLSQAPAGATPSTPSSAMPPPAATAPPVTAMPAPAPWTITPNVSQTPVNPSAPSTSTAPSTAALPPPQ